MPVPAGSDLPPALTIFLHELEQRLSVVESPQGFVAGYLTTSANLTSANIAEAASRWAFATDLGCVVWSDGTHWRRADTGAVIV